MYIYRFKAADKGGFSISLQLAKAGASALAGALLHWRVLAY